jgi:Flp pilus assembly protein TadG
MINLLKPDFTSNEKPSLRVRYLRQFGRDEDGGIIIMTLFLLIIMLVMGGMAVDFMRYESRRALLQSVSDRAVLAAAELDQNLDSTLVVTEYFEKSGFPNAIVGTPTVNVEEGSRSVLVKSELNINTFYLRLIGIDQLDAPATSAAVEGTGNIEISLVLDISGSMGTWVSSESASRMDLLKDAASDFVVDMLDPAFEDQISISLVSYSQHVSLGDSLYNALNTTPDTMIAEGTVLPNGTTAPNGMMVDSSTFDLSVLAEDDYVTNPARCVDFDVDAGEFNTTTFNTARTYDQVEQFEHYRSNRDIEYPLCPQESHQGIFPLSQDADLLTDQIDLFQPTSFTSIHLGMKWGVSLLDPSTRTLLAGVSGVDSVFAGVRPSEYSSTTGVDTVKYVILMTDGDNVAGRRIRSSYYDTNDYSFFWRQTLNEYPYSYWRNNQWRDSVPSHPLNERPGTDTISYRPYSAADANNQLKAICDAAKAEEIIVYTIAMGSGSSQMQNCSTGEGDLYYQTSGDEIDEIFEEIAEKITDLRLSL